MAERDRYEELLLLQRSGAISGLQCQPVFFFERQPGDALCVGKRRVRYTADFQYIEGGLVVVEDVKASNGWMTRDAILRLALMRWWHGIEVRLVTARRRGRR